MRDLDRKQVNVMNRALRNARVEQFNVKINPTGGVPTTYFQVRPLPVGYPSNAFLVNERMFWTRLRDSEQGQVASSPESNAKGSQPSKY